ncbi:MAG: hypothetical protein ACRDVD_08340 [Acidimicrobiia bacterium]
MTNLTHAPTPMATTGNPRHVGGTPDPDEMKHITLIDAQVPPPAPCFTPTI